MRADGQGLTNYHKTSADMRNRDDDDLLSV